MGPVIPGMRMDTGLAAGGTRDSAQDPAAGGLGTSGAVAGYGGGRPRGAGERPQSLGASTWRGRYRTPVTRVARSLVRAAREALSRKHARRVAPAPYRARGGRKARAKGQGGEEWGARRR